MKRFWTAMAVAGFAFGWLAGCNDYNNSIQYNTGATLTNISPSGLPAGTDSFLLTVNVNVEDGFTNTTVIQWNGQKRETSLFVDTITMTGTVPASLLAKPGTAFVNTLTKQSGTGQNGLSNTLAFNIYGAPNPVPTLTSVTPGTAPACGTSCGNAAVTITVVGTNFLPASNNGGSLVTFADKLTPMQQGTSLTITSFSDTQIQAVIPGAFLANPDTATIQVVNPGNGLCTQPSCLPLVGGGNSNPFSFVIGGGGPASRADAGETPASSPEAGHRGHRAQQNKTNQVFGKG